MAKITLKIVAAQCFSNLIHHKQFRNAGILLTGSVMSSAINLVTFALTARTLGPSAFGLLALITSYVAIVDRLVNFQTWQAIVRFGSLAIEDHDWIRLDRVLSYCFRLDAFTAVLGALVGVVVAYILADYVDWLKEHFHLAAMYSLTLIFHLRGVSSGVLRLFNHFQAQAKINVVVALVKLAGVASVVLVSRPSMMMMLVIWMVADIAGGLLELVVAWRCYRREVPISNKEQNSFADYKVIAAERKDIRRFVWTTNLDGAVRVVRDLDMQLIGTLLGTHAVGYYKVARQFNALLTMVVDTSYQAIYPELAKLSARQDRQKMKYLMLQASLLLGLLTLCGGIVFAIAGETILNLVFGDAYAGAYAITLIIISASIVWAFFHPLAPAFMATSNIKSSLLIHAISSFMYFIGVLLLVPAFALTGAGFAYVTFFVIWGMLMLVVALRLKII